MPCSLKVTQVLHRPHDVMFISDSEVITISHHAFSRNIFANGAIKACEWVINQSPGLYSMQDVLRHK